MVRKAKKESDNVVIETKKKGGDGSEWFSYYKISRLREGLGVDGKVGWRKYSHKLGSKETKKTGLCCHFVCLCVFVQIGAHAFSLLSSLSLSPSLPLFLEFLERENIEHKVWSILKTEL